MYNLQLENGGEIKLDSEDYNWIGQYKWKKVDYNRNGKNRIFIKRTDAQIFLHFFLFNYENKNYRFVQLNGDPFDYRRKNLLCLPKVNSNRKKDEVGRRGRESKGKGIIATVIENRATIVSTKKRERTLECEICSELDDQVYMKCLYFCADENWRGWKPIRCIVSESVNYVIDNVGDDIIPKYLFEERILHQIQKEGTEDD